MTHFYDEESEETFKNLLLGPQRRSYFSTTTKQKIQKMVWDELIEEKNEQVKKRGLGIGIQGGG